MAMYERTPTGLAPEIAHFPLSVGRESLKLVLRAPGFCVSALETKIR